MESEDRKRICVVGAGAIGGWIAARLSLAGHHVSIVARGPALARIKDRGIELRHGGTSHIARVTTVDNASALGPQDVILLTVKAPALPSVAGSVTSTLHPGTLVLTVGNGVPWWYFLPPGVRQQGLRLHSVDPQGQVEEAIPFDAIVGMSVFASCHCPEPGVVSHESGGRLVLGEPRGGASPRVSELVETLQGAGLEAVQSSDIRRVMWIKLLGNACFNPASLLTGATVQSMATDIELSPVIAAMMGEAIIVAEALGIEIEIDPAERVTQAGRLGHVKTSMLQDLEGGRPVELRAILGALIECADAAAVNAPLLRALFALAKVRAQQAGLMPT